MRVVKDWNKRSRGCGTTTLGDTQNVSGQGPKQPDLGWPCCKQGVGLDGLQ